MRDIHIVKMDALTHRDESVRKLSIRIIALTVSEFKISKVTERKFQFALRNLVMPDGLVEELNGATRKVNKAQQRAENILKRIRTNVIAHRDGDSLAQYQMIEEIDELTVMRSVTDFFEELSIFSSILTKCFIASSSHSNILIQAVKNIEKEKQNSATSGS